MVRTSLRSAHQRREQPHEGPAIDFVADNVSDMARAKRFYRETLGMDFPIWDDTPRWQEFHSEPVAFALREDKEDPGINAAIAFAVEEVATAVEELRARG